MSFVLLLWSKIVRHCFTRFLRDLDALRAVEPLLRSGFYIAHRSSKLRRNLENSV